MLLLHKKVFREDRLVHMALVLSVLHNLSTMLMRSAPPSDDLPLFWHQDVLLRRYLASLPPEDLRNLINSQDPFEPPPHVPDNRGDWHEFSQFDLGAGMMGQSPWQHHSQNNIYDNYNTGYLSNNARSFKTLHDDWSDQETNPIWNWLNSLSTDNVNAWLNGIFHQNYNHSSFQDEDMISSSESNDYEQNRMNDAFNIHAYVMVGQTSVIPNSTSTHNSRDNVLRPLVNPSPPLTPTSPSQSLPSSPPPAVESSGSVGAGTSYTDPSVGSAGGDRQEVTLSTTPPMSPSSVRRESGVTRRNPDISGPAGGYNSAPATGYRVENFINWWSNNANNLLLLPLYDDLTEEVSELRSCYLSSCFPVCFDRSFSCHLPFLFFLSFVCSQDNSLHLFV